MTFTAIQMIVRKDYMETRLYARVLIEWIRDVGSISNLGARHFRGIFLKKKGTFSKNENRNSLFIAKSWGGTRLQCPPPSGFYVSGVDLELILRLCTFESSTKKVTIHRSVLILFRIAKG